MTRHHHHTITKETPLMGNIGEPRRTIEAPEPVPEHIPEPATEPAEPVREPEPVPA